MISCTQFIPAYSEGFKFLELKGGRKEVDKYWSHLAVIRFRKTLTKLVAEEGLGGCFTYWSRTLSEEAAEFKLVFDEIIGEFRIDMHRCPSKGRLIELEHMEPYHSYCEHCPALYGPALKRLGYKYVKDLSKCNKANCSTRITRIEDLSG